ncbi:hypothetical protein AX14_003134 [Amanita brunnescens Koide BX004]|nr:hypothetical protein AX14_003134 [Amanita brunnescens Koide BX004]
MQTKVFSAVILTYLITLAFATPIPDGNVEDATALNAREASPQPDPACLWGCF